MRTEQITCDGCGHDLTTRSNSVDYRLVLAAESKPGYGSGFYTGMMIYPPVDRAHHFCALSCLDHWRSRENCEADLWRGWWDKWKAEKGNVSPDGRCTSYPTPPEDERLAAGETFKSMALAEFPMERPKHR